MMFIVVALQLNQKSGYDTLKIFLCGLDKGPIIKCIEKASAGHVLGGCLFCVGSFAAGGCDFFCP